MAKLNVNAATREELVEKAGLRPAWPTPFSATA